MGLTPGAKRLRAARSHKARMARLTALDEALQHTYGAPLEALDNKRDPLDEAVYIILSLQTDIPRLKLTWRSLKREFPTWRHAHEASTHTVANAIAAGGLHNQKARILKTLFDSVIERFGALSLDSLRAMSTDDAEHELTCLPGLSWKSARCVLMYSLDRAVFPVDSNTFRIMKRMGILARNEVYRRRAVHDALQAAVPPHRRKPLHVNLVVHGRVMCIPIRPRCTDCPASSLCTQVGVSRQEGSNAN